MQDRTQEGAPETPVSGAETVGERIRRALEAAKWSPEQAASAIQASPSTVYRWMGGQSTPYAKNLKALASALGVRLDYLQVGKGPIWPDEPTPVRQEKEAEANGSEESEPNALEVLRERLRSRGIDPARAHLVITSPSGEPWLWGEMQIKLRLVGEPTVLQVGAADVLQGQMEMTAETN